MFGCADLRVGLPHGHPILLVDRVLELVPGQSITATKAVSRSEVCFSSTRGGADAAYPMPLLLESFVQSAALLWLAGLAGASTDQLLLAGISGAVFYSDVQPGEVVVHRIELREQLGSNAFLAGRSTCAGRDILSVESLILARRPT